jgi:PEGA domain
MNLQQPAKVFGIRRGGHDAAPWLGPREACRGVSWVWRRSWPGLALFALVFAWVGLAWGQAAVEYGGATATMGAVGTSVRPTEVMVSPSAAAAQGVSAITLPARSGPPPDLANRQALAKQAGGLAAKLLLRSVPSNVQVWVDGKFVGRTPLLLLVPPGKHVVQMQGDRQEQGGAQVDLVAHETREVEVQLSERYPTTVKLAGLQ